MKKLISLLLIGVMLIAGTITCFATTLPSNPPNGTIITSDNVTWDLDSVISLIDDCNLALTNGTYEDFLSSYANLFGVGDSSLLPFDYFPVTVQRDRIVIIKSKLNTFKTAMETNGYALVEMNQKFRYLTNGTSSGWHVHNAPILVRYY